MSTSRTCVALLLVAIAAAASSKRDVTDVPTVPSLNVTQYLGTWYQMYTDPFNSVFEPNPFCATAQYGLYPNGTVSVRNIDRSGSYDGPRTEVEGYAYQDDAAAFPGRLSVVFPFNPLPAPYWIIKLGPVIEGQYQYAVVSDDFKISLFVLARNTERFQKDYNAEVFSFLEDMGYDNFLDNATVLPQGPKCHYF